ncbi:hypothetical protein Mgra_00008155 [Meloidogyne graminicola]|uniref:Granulins domain-containing protein n=1 Tax=Meloidogyne graminicola TaxID=189291 RepID=A0A8S9ZGU5_9BILA|nr:hypothetical protein Mgra_00008155 [Meloidogyne graminicola]
MKNSTLICLTIISLFFVINLNQVSSTWCGSYLPPVICKNGAICCHNSKQSSDYCCPEDTLCDDTHVNGCKTKQHFGK